MLAQVEQVWRRCLFAVEAFARILVVLLTAAVVLQAISRLLHMPLPWSVEASRVLFAWLGFTGLIVAVSTGVVPDFPVFRDRLPGRWPEVLRLATTVLVLIFLVSMFISTFRIVQIAHAQSMSVLPFQWSYVYLSLPATLFCLTVIYALRLIHLAKGLRDHNAATRRRSGSSPESSGTL
jgi:TRAP-type C4-dicarboxylate transport system permease small subunit